MSLITDLRKSVFHHIGASKVSTLSIQPDYEPVLDGSLALEPPPAKRRSRRAAPADSAATPTPEEETTASDVIVAPDDITSTQTMEILAEADHLMGASAAPESPLLSAGKTTKAALCLEMLRTEAGASVADIMTATGWQAHSVRGFLSATVRKKLGLDLVSFETESGGRRYKIAAGSHSPVDGLSRGGASALNLPEPEYVPSDHDVDSQPLEDDRNQIVTDANTAATGTDAAPTDQVN